MNESANNARRHLVELLYAMLGGKLSFFEGAAQVVEIDRKLLGISARDPDLDKFVLVRSETDHLPLKEQQSAWSAEALRNLRGEFEETEKWAQSFVPEACRNLIARFEANR